MKKKIALLFTGKFFDFFLEIMWPQMDAMDGRKPTKKSLNFSPMHFLIFHCFSNYEAQ